MEGGGPVYSNDIILTDRIESHLRSTAHLYEKSPTFSNKLKYSPTSDKYNVSTTHQQISQHKSQRNIPTQIGAF
jgi:hypothetical protein